MKKVGTDHSTHIIRHYWIYNGWSRGGFAYAPLGKARDDDGRRSDAAALSQLAPASSQLGRAGHS